MKKYLVTYSYNAGLLGTDKIFNSIEEVKQFEEWYINQFNDSNKYYEVVEITITKKFFRTITSDRVVKTWSE